MEINDAIIMKKLNGVDTCLSQLQNHNWLKLMELGKYKNRTQGHDSDEWNQWN